MKQILLFAFALFITLSSTSQTENDYLEMSREVLKVEKKAAIADVMKLTEAESQPFWNLYNDFQAKLYTVHNKRIAIIKDFAENFESLSNEKADDLLVKHLKYQTELLKLKKSYYKKFKKILPAGKAARFFQAENKIETLIDAKLALDIPMIKTN